MAYSKSNKAGSYFLQYIKRRIKHNKNFINGITGSTGSGKSYSAVRLGEALDPNFDIRNVCFTDMEFMDLVDGITKKLRKGAVIIFDEIQVTMGHLDYQSMRSKCLNYVLQTFRHRNFILIMTSPYFAFINASLRKLFHCRMETMSIDYKEKAVKIKPLLLQTNQDTGKIYKKYLRVWTPMTGMQPLKRINIGLPSEKLLEDYEAKKDAFTRDLNRGIRRDLLKLAQKESGTGAEKALTTRQEQVVELLLEKKTIPEIAEKLEIEKITIYEHLKLIKRKGLQIIPVKDKDRVLYYTVKGYEKIY